jgi:hypothetical protein
VSGFETRARSGEASSATVLLSDRFAGRQAARHHAEGEQDDLADDGDDQQGQDGFGPSKAHRSATARRKKSTAGPIS